MMQLIGYLDSPFVRRVAVSMRFLGIDYKHRELSIFRDYDEFRKIHPSVKVPTLVTSEGDTLIDSTLIIQYLESHVAQRSLMPAGRAGFAAASEQVGVAMAAMEKVAQLIYETGHRPEERQHQPWIDRIENQLLGAMNMMEGWVTPLSGNWLHGENISQADISIAAVYRFTQHIDRAPVDPADFPALARFSERAEALPEFIACPLSS